MIFIDYFTLLMFDLSKINVIKNGKTSSFCFWAVKERERERENICLHFRVSIVGGVEHLAHTTTNLSVIFVQFYWQHSCFEIKNEWSF